MMFKLMGPSFWTMNKSIFSWVAEVAMMDDRTFKNSAAEIGFTPAPSESMNNFRMRVVTHLLEQIPG